MATAQARKAGPKKTRQTVEQRRLEAFRHRLGSLTYHQACQLLGDDGSMLIRRGGQHFDVQSGIAMFIWVEICFASE